MNEYDRLKAQKNTILEKQRQELLMLLYGEMVAEARNRNQTIGEKNDYYLTIWQIEAIMLAKSRETAS